MDIKDYIKYIKNEIMNAGVYACAAKSYKKKNEVEQAQSMQKLAMDSVNKVEMLFKMLNTCVEKEAKEHGDKIYKELYEECIDVMLEEHKEVEIKLKN